MTTAVAEAMETTGCKVRKLRLSCLLTRRELAERAGVPNHHVALFEHDWPLPLDSRRRIFKELWAAKAAR